MRAGWAAFVCLALTAGGSAWADSPSDLGPDAGAPTAGGGGAGGDAGAAPLPGDAGSESELFDLGDSKVTQALRNDVAPDETLNADVVTAGAEAGEAKSLAAADITVVDRDEIALHGWRSLVEILANVPGLYVVDDLVLPSVGVRGVSGGLQAGTRIVKVMINGVPISFRPDLSAFIGPEFIPMEAVERVEIAKGPLSALYGANAFLAVVNVITRQPNGGLSGEAALRGGADRGYPSYGASGQLAYGDEGVSVLASVSADHTDRSGLGISETFPAQDPSSPRYAGDFGSRSQGDLSLPISAFGQLGLGTPEHLGKLLFQGGLQQLDSMGNFQLNSALSNSRISIDNFWSNASYEKTFSRTLSLTISFGYATGSPTRDERLYLTGDTDSYYHPSYAYTAYDGSVELAYTFGKQLSLKAGVDGEIDHETVLYYSQTLLEAENGNQPGTTLSIIKSNEALQQDIDDLGIYLQATSVPFRSLPGLHLTGNLRLDKPNLFDWQFSWRAAAAYRFNKSFTLKVFAGRAFQSPSGVLLFSQGGFGLSGDIIGARSEPTLNPVVPQVLQSVEAALAAKLLDHASADVGVYAQEIDDHISFLPSGYNLVASNGVPGATNDTAPVQQNVGAEVSLRAYLDRFTLYASGSLQQSVFGGTLSQLPPPLYPNIFGRVGVDVAVPEAHLKLSAQVRGVGSRGSSDSNTQFNNLTPYTLPPYADVDLSLSAVELHVLGKRPLTQLRAAVFNLFDERHSEPGFGGFDVPNLGRVIAVELRQAF